MRGLKARSWQAVLGVGEVDEPRQGRCFLPCTMIARGTASARWTSWQYRYYRLYILPCSITLDVYMTLVPERKSRLQAEERCSMFVQQAPVA